MAALVLSPLGLAFLYCALVDQESFGAFLLGISFTLLFSAMVLLRFLAKKLDAWRAKKKNNA